jgi:hypothetical protein
MSEPLDQTCAELTRVRELVDRGDYPDALDLLESVRDAASNPATKTTQAATSMLWQILSAVYEIRDLASDERTLRRAEALTAQTQRDLDEASRTSIAERRRVETIQRFHERAKQPQKRTFLAGALIWSVLLPVWVGALFAVAAVGGTYGNSPRWPELVASLLLFAGPWFFLGWSTIRWWHEGRNHLWRPPLVWLLLLIPYLWPALFSRRVRALLSAPRPE